MIKVITNQFCWSKIENDNVPLHENNYLKLRYDYFQHKIDDGQIVMVNSMSGHRVAPGKLRFYSATKFAVTGLLEGWRQEVNDPSAKYFHKAFFNIKIFVHPSAKIIFR